MSTIITNPSAFLGSPLDMPPKDHARRRGVLSRSPESPDFDPLEGKAAALFGRIVLL